MGPGRQPGDGRDRGGSWGARRNALKRSPYIDPHIRRTRRRTSRLVFELDDVGVVVDADGAEFAEDVLAEEAVKLDAQELA